MKTDLIKIYGSPKSSSGRVYWMLEELGLAYERVPLQMANRDHKSAEYLKLNPNGKIPCLIDGDIKLWESMAINSYLGEQYDESHDLIGKSAIEKGLIHQWSYWAILELQKHCVEWLIQEKFVSADKRNPAIIEKAQKAIPPLITILNDSLFERDFLVSNRFTMADLHVASVVDIAVDLGLSLDSWTSVKRWLSACHERPAWIRTRSLPL